MKVVIIEDNERYSRILENILDGFATEVVVVATWAGAKPYLETNPDVVWIDLQLPDSDPNQTVVKIAEVRAKNGEVAIIVVSGYVDPALEKAALMSGADVIESKNISGTRQKILSLILLALTRAQKRMPTERRVSLLEHAGKLIRDQFPQQQST
jgi:DNA-binding NarL/FixJ family response regulator